MRKIFPIFILQYDSYSPHVAISNTASMTEELDCYLAIILNLNLNSSMWRIAPLLESAYVSGHAGDLIVPDIL